MIIGKGAIDMSQRHFDYWSWVIDQFNNYTIFVVESKYLHIQIDMKINEYLKISLII